VNTVGGLRNAMTFVLTGLDVEAKAALVRRQLEPVLSRVREADVRLARTDHEDPETTERASALLTITVKDADPARVGRQFSSAAVEIALASYPGCTLTAPPGDGTPYGVFHPAYVPNEAVWQEAMLPDGTTVAVPPLDEALASAHPAQTTAPTGAGAPRAVTGSRGCRRVPLGAVFGARSGDKGADANVGIWARSEEAYTWLADQLDVPRLQALLPETVGLEVERYLLPNLRAVNFVIRGLLGEGVASSPRFDPQAKGLGEWLRSRIVELPAHLVDTE